MRAVALDKLQGKQHEMKERELSKPRHSGHRPAQSLPNLTHRINLIAKACIMDLHGWSESRIALHLNVPVKDVKNWKQSGFRLA